MTAARTAPLLAFAVAFGLAAGLGGYTFVYARGASYLTNDPAACANCHVMSEHYAGWMRSSHRSVATCNDCHTPPGLVGKYSTKAMNGFWHSFAFTTGRYPDPLLIKGRNRDIAEAACRKCHAALVSAMDTGHDAASTVSCIRCHGAVGHPTLATSSGGRPR
jgi:cytochrome c nitrite reductase small subunit